MIITWRADQCHRYHSPAAAEIAAIYSTKESAAPDPNDRIMHIQSHDGFLIAIKATSQAADPLTYLLLFPFREHGWGGQRSMEQNYQDAMTIVRKHGKPDIFLTFTANPSWQEILDNLLPNQKPQDRPDVVTQVFNLRVKELLCDIRDLDFFGKVIAYIYTVELQKRGLPHTHLSYSISCRAGQTTHTRAS
eukprot:gene13153-biopygen10486